MSRLIKSGAFWFTVLATVLLVAGVTGSIVFWDWLHPNTPAEVSKSTTLRNVGLLIGGILALVFAGWRGWVAERQAGTAQQGLLNERYQKGAEMLGSDILSVRLGGIYALERLDAEHPEQYHIQIMKLFCAFVRHPADDSDGRPLDSETNPTAPSTDVQAVMDAIGARGDTELELEKLEGYKLDLRRVKLRRASLGMANLSGARLAWACLEGAALEEANLANAILNQANLTGATLGGAKLVGASLRRAILPSAVFWNFPGPLQFITYYNALQQGGVLTANLSKAKLENSDLSGASLEGSDLSCAYLTDVILSGANLSDANLSGATLVRANLSGVILSEDGKIPVTGLTQYQLDQACADPDNPPMLDGVVDAETGKPLIWRGKPCTDSTGAGSVSV